MQRPEKIISEAVAKRLPFPNEHTNAVRLIDGYGDGMPDLYVDAYAGRWVVATLTRDIDPTWKEALIAHAEAENSSLYWKTLDQHQKDSPVHLAGPPQDESFLARENGLNYEINFQAGYSQGIFLDQRENRQLVRELCSAGDRVLNTFAYTGPFSVAAAAGGATTTTLDLSQPYLEWAKRNLSHNEIDPTAHYFCKGDTFHWLKRFAKQGRQFQGIILDPPTFSRDDKGKVFRVEKDYDRLVALAAGCLSDDGWLLCCTNYHQLTPPDFNELIYQGLADSPQHANKEIESLPMPAEYTETPYLKSTLVSAR